MRRPGLRALAVALAAVGIAVAGYLTVVHYTGVQPVCAGGGAGCERVQASDQSRLLGVPVALLGLLAYAVLLAAGAARTELTRSVAAFTALAGFGFSAYLTQQAIVDIGATCQWCLASFGLMTALAVVSVARLLRGA